MNNFIPYHGIKGIMPMVSWTPLHDEYRWCITNNETNKQGLAWQNGSHRHWNSRHWMYHPWMAVIYSVYHCLMTESYTMYQNWYYRFGDDNEMRVQIIISSWPRTLVRLRISLYFSWCNTIYLSKLGTLWLRTAHEVSDFLNNSSQ